MEECNCGGLVIETVVCELGGLLATGVSTWFLEREQFGSGRSTISKFPQHLGVNFPSSWWGAVVEYKEIYSLYICII